MDKKINFSTEKVSMKYQMEILKLKNAINEIKNSKAGCGRR